MIKRRVVSPHEIDRRKSCLLNLQSFGFSMKHHLEAMSTTNMYIIGHLTETLLWCAEDMTRMAARINVTIRPNCQTSSANKLRFLRLRRSTVVCRFCTVQNA